MNRIDRYAAEHLIKNKNIKNSSIAVYTFCLTLAKEESDLVFFENHSIYMIFKKMKEKMHWINKQNIYNGFYTLVKEGFFILHGNKIVLPHMGNGHIKSDSNFKGSGYIKLHKVFFDRLFYDLNLCDKKLLIKFLLHLNGKKNKELPYNVQKHQQELFEICKVNRLAHLKYILSRLSTLLDIRKSNLPKRENVFLIKLNTITTNILEKAKKIYTYTQNQFEYIKHLVHTYEASLNDEELRDLTESLLCYSGVIVKQAVFEYCSVRKYSEIAIKSPGAYIKAIANRISTTI